MNHIYKEDDWIAEVKIVEDLSDSEYLRYKLEVVENIRQTKIHKPVKVGQQFECCHLRTWKGTGWSMEAIK